MRFRSLACAVLAVASCFPLTTQVFALEDAESEDVSPEVDQALWCGAYYAIIQQVAKDDPAKQKLAENYSGQAFTKGGEAMIADGIEQADQEGVIKYYVDMAVEEVESPEDDNRYTDDECFTLITP